jgi:hypothetical protein
MVYSGGTSGKVFVWEGNTLKEVIQAHQGTVMAMQTLEKVKGNIASKISPRLPFKPGEPGSILG